VTFSFTPFTHSPYTDPGHAHGAAPQAAPQSPDRSRSMRMPCAPRPRRAPTSGAGARTRAHTRAHARISRAHRTEPLSCVARHSLVGSHHGPWPTAADPHEIRQQLCRTPPSLRLQLRRAVRPSPPPAPPVPALTTTNTPRSARPRSVRNGRRPTDAPRTRAGAARDRRPLAMGPHARTSWRPRPPQRPPQPPMSGSTIVHGGKMTPRSSIAERMRKSR